MRVSRVECSSRSADSSTLRTFNCPTPTQWSLPLFGQTAIMAVVIRNVFAIKRNICRQHPPLLLLGVIPAPPLGIILCALCDLMLMRQANWADTLSGNWWAIKAFCALFLTWSAAALWAATVAAGHFKQKWKWGSGQADNALCLSTLSVSSSAFIDWCSRDCNSKNCQQTTLFKAAFMKYSCCMLKSPQQRHEQQLSKWPEQQQAASVDRTIAQGAEAAAHKWCQTLVPHAE